MTEMNIQVEYLISKKRPSFLAKAIAGPAKIKNHRTLFMYLLTFILFDLEILHIRQRFSVAYSSPVYQLL